MSRWRPCGAAVIRVRRCAKCAVVLAPSAGRERGRVICRSYPRLSRYPRLSHYALFRLAPNFFSFRVLCGVLTCACTVTPQMFVLP